MKIYTKKGDKGYTSTVKGERISKSDILLDLQGGVDEINANIGFLRSLVEEIKDEERKNYIDSMLKEIQYHLFRMGVEISSQFKDKYITDELVGFLEKEIDNMTSKTEPIKNFIHYFGPKQATHSHVIRTITRRTERIFVEVLGDQEYPESYSYINRLSDYFYTLARYISFQEGYGDEIMKLR